METTTIIILIITGIFAGVLGGMLGVGGGIIMIPAMVLILGYNQHLAQGTSIAAMLLPVGIFAAYNYYKLGFIDIKSAIILTSCITLGAYLGSKIAINVNEYYMKKIFGLFLLLVALRMILWK